MGIVKPPSEKEWHPMRSKKKAAQLRGSMAQRLAAEEFAAV